MFAWSSDALYNDKQGIPPVFQISELLKNDKSRYEETFSRTNTTSWVATMNRAKVFRSYLKEWREPFEYYVTSPGNQSAGLASYAR